jgi:cystathionine beta-lyase/cystathionine gamma-synthase
VVKDDTWIARIGAVRPSLSQPATTPIFQTAVYDFADLDALEAVWTKAESGFIYGRFGQPNSQDLEEAVAKLESAEAGLACGSGMGAISAALMSTLEQGSHLVAAQGIYGGTSSLLLKELGRFGVTSSFVDIQDLGQIESAITERTRLILIESLSNPLVIVPDLPAIVALARRYNLKVLVDNTLAPCLLKPHDHGADFVVHSVTKYLGGHADLTAGVLTGSTESIQLARRAAITLGLTAPAFDCWLACRGLKTLPLRLERHCFNAQKIAEFLSDQPQVKQVYYPGLPSHNSYHLAQQLFAFGGGPLLSFELAGGYPAVDQLIKHLPSIPLSPSFGGINTSLSYPAKTSHRALSTEEQEHCGIRSGLLRLSVGIEHWEDLCTEFATAFRNMY